MRKIINISLPEKMAKMAKERARKSGFDSLSEYVRVLIDSESELISEEKLLKMAREAEKEYRTGKLKARKSMASLLRI